MTEEPKRPSHPYRDPATALTALEEGAVSGADAEALLDAIVEVRSHIDAGSFDELSRVQIAAINKQFARIRVRFALRGPDVTINATIIGVATAGVGIIVAIASPLAGVVAAVAAVPIVLERLYTMTRAKVVAAVVSEFLLLEEHFRKLSAMGEPPDFEPAPTHTSNQREVTRVRADARERGASHELQPPPRGPNVPGKKRGR